LLVIPIIDYHKLLVKINIIHMNASWIKYLRECGYEPELQDGQAFRDRLKNYLGEAKFKEHWARRKRLDKYPDNFEDNLLKEIGTDEQMLRIYYSSQILKSLRLLEGMMTLSEDEILQAKWIADFGGSNGWVFYLLKKIWGFKGQGIVIDQNATWQPVDPELLVFCSPYRDVNLEEAADLSLSILGAPQSGFFELLESMYRNTRQGGLVVVALRISGAEGFLEFIRLAAEIGLRWLPTHSARWQCDDEVFPVFSFQCADAHEYPQSNWEKHYEQAFSRISGRPSGTKKVPGSRMVDGAGQVNYDLIIEYGQPAYNRLKALDHAVVIAEQRYEGHHMLMYELANVWYQAIHYSDGDLVLAHPIFDEYELGAEAVLGDVLSDLNYYLGK